jgi:hypothetical protein
MILLFVKAIILLWVLTILIEFFSSGRCPNTITIGGCNVNYVNCNTSFVSTLPCSYWTLATSCSTIASKGTISNLRDWLNCVWDLIENFLIKGLHV